MRSIRKLLPLLAVAALHASVASAEETYRWIQYDAKGNLEARMATNASSCPDGMSKRAERDDVFPILVCTVPIPNGAKDVVVGGLTLTLPAAEPPSRILLVGDTGCRIKGENVQKCVDPKAWPFKSVADVAAKMKPDLIIHVGDYYYRESACPNDKLCKGPSGDTWDTWRADFFEPVGSLLTAAPWVFVRGNHEKCGRGDQGWSRLLEALPFAAGAPCRDLNPSFTVDIGGVKLVVLDVSAANEDQDKVDHALAERFRPKFEAVASVNGPVWLALHEPIWSPKDRKDGNETLALAARDVIPSNVQAMLSGHIHIFEVMSYDKAELPIQIVSGNGGDSLECAKAKKPEAKSSEIGSKCKGLGLVSFSGRDIKFRDPGIASAKIGVGRGVPDAFGFSMLERDQGGWNVVNYDAHAHKRLSCHMQGRTLDCH